MKFKQLLNEKIEDLKNKKGILVCDIDDCLLKADPNSIGIWKIKDGKETRLTTEQFAKDPESKKPYPPGVNFDLREFRDPKRVYDSIVKGTPVLSSLKLLDAHVNAGFDVMFLTARGLQDIVEKAFNNFIRFRDKEGKLKELGPIFKKSLSAAVNDEGRVYVGGSDSEKKGNVLRDICNKYDIVKFIDDDQKNINFAKSLNIPNLTVIKVGDK